LVYDLLLLYTLPIVIIVMVYRTQAKENTVVSQNWCYDVISDCLYLDSFKASSFPSTGSGNVWENNFMLFFI